MPNPHSERRQTGRPGPTDKIPSTGPRPLSTTILRERFSQEDLASKLTPPNSGIAKRARLDDSGTVGPSAHKRPCLEIQPLPASPPPPLHYLQAPTPFTCLSMTSDVMVEGHNYREHGSYPHVSGNPGPTVAPGTGRQNTPTPWQAANTPDLYDDPELEQILDHVGEYLSTGPSQGIVNHYDTEETSYLEDFDDQAVEELLEDCTWKADQIPPSSVVRACDRDSRSAEEFDPNLQHSPLCSSSSTTALIKDDILLNHETDWSQVHECAQMMPKANSPVGSLETRTLKSLDSKPKQSASPSPTLRSSATSKPNTPGPFPSQMFLKAHKTFFHIREMVDAKEELFKNQPEAVFELFARVVYSSRENFHHKQYFQFRSLLKECPPYLNGALLS
ncbi:hypothetical protein AK830_g10058 [Neonectria ditissima]|uniref:Uncharacterized protein n=1 Tax=Neonectria ditissima TaxID=78410 RepID=A0A0P7B4C4_9HYPO|nr:hypothetical protein AK830_g10058 [Neonectria ditissima]